MTGMRKRKTERMIYTFTTSLSPEALRERVRVDVYAKGNMLYENTEAGFDIGVSRGGHSGGYWYVATLTEGDGQTTVSGEIVFRSCHSNGELREETKREKILEWIAFVLIFLLILPAALVALAIWGIIELIGKLRGRPTEMTMSDGEKLTYFMTETVGCSVV